MLACSKGRRQLEGEAVAASLWTIDILLCPGRAYLLAVGIQRVSRRQRASAGLCAVEAAETCRLAVVLLCLGIGVLKGGEVHVGRDREHIVDVAHSPRGGPRGVAKRRPGVVH